MGVYFGARFERGGAPPHQWPNEVELQLCAEIIAVEAEPYDPRFVDHLVRLQLLQSQHRVTPALLCIIVGMTQETSWDGWNEQARAHHRKE